MLELLEEESEYCFYYKNLTVEELACVEYPIQLHYGKCAVIGTTIFQNDQYYLENIRMPFLTEKYSLPSGTLNIKLLTTVYKGIIPIGKTCEIFGEAVLFDNQNLENNILPKTSLALKKDIITRFNMKKGNLSLYDQNRFFEQIIYHIKQKYDPAIRIHSIFVVDQAEELIMCNLSLRLSLIEKQQTFANIN